MGFVSKVLCLVSTVALMTACGPVTQFPLDLTANPSGSNTLTNEAVSQPHPVSPEMQGTELLDPPLPGSFSNFVQEVNRVNEAIVCPAPKISPAVDLEIGQLYGCYLGLNKAVRVFVSESPEQAVKDIKLMWSQSHQTATGEINPDAEIAQEMIAKLIGLYAPDFVPVFQTKFFVDESMAIQTDRLLFRYTFTPGYAASERLITITQRDKPLVP